MSAGLANFNVSVADDLDAAVHSNLSCVFFDTRRYKYQFPEISAWLMHTVQNAPGELHEFNGAEVSEAGLLAKLGKGRANFDAELSIYRRLTSIIDSSQPAYLAIYEADELDTNGLHIVARLARYLAKTDSGWKVLLFADGQRLKKLDMFQLPIDLSFDQIKSTGSSESDNNGAKNKQSKPALLTGLFLCAALSAVGLLFFNSQPKAPDLNQTNTPPHSVDHSDSSSSVQPPGGNNRFDEANADDSRWLSNEEFDAIMARLAEPATPIKKDQPVQIAADKKPAVKPTAYSNQMSEEMSKALEANDWSRLQALIASGENINSRAAEQQTGLILASISGEADLVKELLDLAASTNLTDEHGRTALYYAAVHGHQDIAQTLLEHGAKPNLASNLKKTPLMAAAHNGYVELAQLLLKNRARINAQDHSGWTALFYAVWNNNLDMSTTLMNFNPDLTISDNSGNTIEAIARARNNAEILRLLELDH